VIENYDEAIAQEKLGREKTLNEMKALSEQFEMEVVSFISEWYVSTAEKYVLQNPDNTIELGTQKIGEMKHEIENLVEDSENIVKRVFREDEVWWHRILDFNDPHFYISGSDRQPKELEIAVRLVAGHLGKILSQYGYVKVTGTRFSESEVWREYDRTGNYKMGGRPIYPYQLDWTDGMKKKISEYRDLGRKYIDITKKINEIEERKKESLAKRIWESNE